QCASMIRRSLTTAFILLAVSTFAQTTNDKPIAGFTPANAAKEHALEAQFDAKMNRDDLRNWMQRLSARPHHLGSDYDRQNQEFIASLYRSWGYDTHIEEFSVLRSEERRVGKECRSRWVWDPEQKRE